MGDHRRRGLTLYDNCATVVARLFLFFNFCVSALSHHGVFDVVGLGLFLSVGVSGYVSTRVFFVCCEHRAFLGFTSPSVSNTDIQSMDLVPPRTRYLFFLSPSTFILVLCSASFFRIFPDMRIWYEIRLLIGRPVCHGSCLGLGLGLSLGLGLGLSRRAFLFFSFLSCFNVVSGGTRRLLMWPWGFFSP